MISKNCFYIFIHEIMGQFSASPQFIFTNLWPSFVLTYACFCARERQVSTCMWRQKVALDFRSGSRAHALISTTELCFVLMHCSLEVYRWWLFNTGLRSWPLRTRIDIKFYIVYFYFILLHFIFNSDFNDFKFSSQFVFIVFLHIISTIFGNSFLGLVCCPLNLSVIVALCEWANC